MSAPHLTAAPQLEAESRKAREFIAGFKFAYHRYEHSCERLEYELREIMAGNRRTTRRLRHLRDIRDAHAQSLDLYLAQVCRRLKDRDTKLRELLQEKFKTYNDGKFRPLITDDEEEDDDNTTLSP